MSYEADMSSRMQAIYNFFENMNEVVYVADMDTHELVYLNKKGLDAYGLQSLDDIRGRKCHDVLQHASAPCTICTNDELRLGHFKEWEYHNPAIDRHFMLKDTMMLVDGRRYRIEIAIDMTLQEKQRSMFDSYQKVEEIVNAGLRLAMTTKTPDRGINVLLEYLGKALQADRTYIFERNDRGNDDNTYEWVAAGASSEKATLQDLPAEVNAHWYNAFRKDEIIVIRDVEEIREEDPLQYENLKRQNISTLVGIPLYEKGVAIGFYGVDNPPRHLLSYSADILQIMGHFIISLLRSRNLIAQLREMSSHDRLTGFGNRYALDDYAATLDGRGSLGVVFCDITGLKGVNDTRGHTEGDMLILRACDCLKKAFGGWSLFRIGGDEFLVLCRGIERAELMDRITNLKEKLQESDVVMALGIAWYDNCFTSNIDKLMIEAEMRMYRDKAAYYKAAGIDRRL